MRKKTTEPQVEMLTQSQVLEMGFTKGLIAKLLPEPTLKQNPRYRSAAPMKLWPAEDVHAAMETEEFRAMREKADARSKAAQKGVQTRREAAVADLDELIREIRIRKIGMKVLREAAISAGIDRIESRGGDPIYLDDSTVTRWMVNYVRHNLCEYDYALPSIDGKIGRDSLYVRLKSAVLWKIAEVYPELADECRAQVPSAPGPEADSIRNVLF